MLSQTVFPPLRITLAKSAFWDRAFAVLPMEQIKGTRSHISSEAGSPPYTTTLSASNRMKGHENFFVLSLRYK